MGLLFLQEGDECPQWGGGGTKDRQQKDDFNKCNRVLYYFLSCSVTLTIKIIKHTLYG